MLLTQHAYVEYERRLDCTYCQIHVEHSFAFEPSEYRQDPCYGQHAQQQRKHNETETADREQNNQEFGLRSMQRNF